MVIRAIIYEGGTGETKEDVEGMVDAVYAVYKFNDYEAMQHHILQANVPNTVVSEITEDEYSKLRETDIETNQYIYKVDVSKIRTYLKDRKKENYTINIEGISYQDKRPEKAIIKK